MYCVFKEKRDEVEHFIESYNYVRVGQVNTRVCRVLYTYTPTHSASCSYISRTYTKQRFSLLLNIKKATSYHSFKTNTLKDMESRVLEKKYFFIKIESGKGQCLICRRQLARCDNFTATRHFNSRHKEYKNMSDLDREELLKKLKQQISTETSKKMEGINIQNDLNSNFISTTSKQIAKASYIVSIALAKQCRPYDDGIFIKTICQNILMCFGERGEEFSNLIETVPLSRQTIVRRTEDVGRYLYSKVKKRLDDCLFFSFCLDESTDITDLCQIIIFVKTVHENFETHEDFLTVVSQHDHVNGESIWQVVCEQIFAKVDKRKLSAICTDGAHVMVGKSKGLVGFLNNSNIIVPSFHCIIHQQALLGKFMNFSETMKKSIQIINKIRGGHNALSHRKFKTFLEELKADYGDLLLFTEVRWLSRGRSLTRLFDLRDEVADFLRNDHSEVSQTLSTHFNDKNFILNLAFLSDISMILNDLNLNLQGKNKHIFHLLPAIKRFSEKLGMLKQQLSTKNLKSLPKTATVFSESDDLPVLQQFVSIIDLLLENVQKRFQDFGRIESIIDLLNNDLACEAIKQSAAVQEELKEMLSDISIPFATGKEFWHQINRRKYPHATNEILKLYSMFGTTYNCESAFSFLKLIKSKSRNNISDKHLEDVIRIKLYEDEIDVEQILEEKM